MRNLLRISDAAVLGIHALAVLGGSEEPVAASRMAEAMNVSLAHLNKVLQRLTRADLVESVRGPKGGYMLVAKPEDVSLLTILETIDGDIGHETCLLGSPVCRISDECPVRRLSAKVRELVVGEFGSLSLTDIDLSELLQES